MNKEYCDKCGRELVNFIYNNNNYDETYGCPVCDDTCVL